MQIDVMVSPMRWDAAADLARKVEGAGFTGMTFVETAQTPWMGLAAAATAAPTLNFTTGIAVAFPVSPMTMSALAWELARNTNGRFRLGLGPQIKAHIERRYGVAYDPPGPRMRDYLLAVRDVLTAMRGEGKLDHHSEHFDLTLLPPAWLPPAHEFGHIKLDVSAVGPWMCKMAGEIADGIQVHPLHSMNYINTRLIPDVAIGAEKAGRAASDVDLLIPVFIAPGDTPEERAFLVSRARQQIAFYGSTPNYAYQFTDLGFEGITEKVRLLLREGDTAGMEAAITDEMLEHFAVVGPWDSIADTLISRYGKLAERVISYLTADDLERNPQNLGRWGEIARAVRAA
jgi:probable F420-dependent oxidoreductase